MSKNNAKLDGQALALSIIKYALLGLSALYTLLIVFGRLIPPIATTQFYESADIFTKTEGFNPWLRSLSYLLCILTIAVLFRYALTFSFAWLKHGKSIISLLSSFVKYVAMVIIIFCILASFGVDTSALIAGIGILSLIVGLAIQPLLQDIIAGIFVVFEKTYDVGDVLVVDGFRGTVTEIGIRATKIKDAGGDIKVINNSDIRTLVNMTGDLSVAISDVDIEYGESLERVEGVIEKNLDVIREKIPEIVDGPYYKGVVSLGANGVTLRLVAQCSENAKFQTQRDMNRQIKLIFDANDINIPYSQVVVHQPSQAPSADAYVKSTDDFVTKQKSLSKNIENDENNN